MPLSNFLIHLIIFCLCTCLLIFFAKYFLSCQSQKFECPRNSFLVIFPARRVFFKKFPGSGATTANPFVPPSLHPPIIRFKTFHGKQTGQIKLITGKWQFLLTFTMFLILKQLFYNCFSKCYSKYCWFAFFVKGILSPPENF